MFADGFRVDKAKYEVREEHRVIRWGEKERPKELPLRSG
jgi:hypothetical protein